MAIVVVTAVTVVGAAVYVAAWLLLPAEDEEGTIAGRALRDPPGLAMVVALVPLLVAAVVLAGTLRAGWLDRLAGSAFATAAGALLVWRDGTPADRDRLAHTGRAVLDLAVGARGSWRSLAARVAAAAALVLAGVVVLAGHLLHRPVLGAGLVTAGVVVAVGPWWLDMGRQLVEERQARLRAEERAEMASRVHDSVLQTLALIQRHADDPARVGQLARLQERELRSWLFEGRPPGDPASEATTLAEAVRRIQADVEAAHGVTVETVVVGDTPLTPAVDALLAAGREATVNAAKWSGAAVVSVFAEADGTTVSLFVRDRGVGFDRSAVAPDRRGLSESVEGRMERAGGRATVRSAPGEGTEVALEVPTHPGRPARR